MSGLWLWCTGEPHVGLFALNGYNTENLTKGYILVLTTLNLFLLSNLRSNGWQRNIFKNHKILPIATYTCMDEQLSLSKYF